MIIIPQTRGEEQISQGEKVN